MSQVEPRLDGRVVLLTGGAGHLGAEFARALAAVGARVVLVDRDQAQLDKVRTADGAAFESIAVDLADEQATAKIVDEVVRRAGRLDVLVNNAAFTGASGIEGFAVPLPRQSLAAWNAAMRVNLGVPFQLTQAALEPLSATNGTVVNVSSIYGLVGPDFSLYEGTAMGNPAAYAASKGGLLQLTRYFATVMAPRVRVNAISPGGIARGQPESFVTRYEKRTPLGRMAREPDFVGALLFLASDLSRYVTGQNIVVDGGWTAW